MLRKIFFKDKWRLLLVIILFIFQGLFAVLPFDFFGSILDGINSGTLSYRELMIKICFMVLSALFLYLFSAFAEYVVFIGYHIVCNDVEEMMIKKVLKQTPVFYEKFSIGEIMGRITNDIYSYVAPFFGFGYHCIGMGIVQNLIVFIFVTSKIGFTFALLINLPYLIQVFHSIINKHRFEKLYKDMMSKFDLISENILENIRGIRINRAYNMYGGLRKQYVKDLDKYSKSSFVYKYVTSVWETTSIMAVSASYLVLIVYGFYLYSQGLATFGSLIGVSLVMALMPWPYSTLSFLILMLNELKLGTTRINHILEEPDVMVEKENGEILKFLDKIEFKGYSFTYPNGTSVLHDINLVITKGEMVGIMGKTGSGKTTLIKQLLRLYDTDSGIYIDGKDIREYSVKSLRDNFSYASQEYFIFSKTIRENILFGRNLEDKLEYSLEFSDLAKDVEKFEKGLETMVGENGVSLSGGQKQRLGIARAVIEDKEITIFDDSLSALDTNTEKNIIANMNKYRKGKTNIIVSHRISSVINADKIIILNGGKIENIGTHNELLETSSWYKELYDYQMRKEGLENV